MVDRSGTFVKGRGREKFPSPALFKGRGDMVHLPLVITL